jgi:hypothetical protein
MRGISEPPKRNPCPFRAGRRLVIEINFNYGKIIV